MLFRESPILDVEEKAICSYFLDRLDKLGPPAQRELLRGSADYWTPTSTDEKPSSVGQYWDSRFLERYPEYTLKVKKSSIHL